MAAAQPADVTSEHVAGGGGAGATVTSLPPDGGVTGRNQALACYNGTGIGRQLSAVYPSGKKQN
jgi:hypothetical protein